MNSVRTPTIPRLMAWSLGIVAISLCGGSTRGEKADVVGTGERQGDAAGAEAAEARVVRIYEWGPVTVSDGPETTVTIKDSQGNRLEQYTIKFGYVSRGHREHGRLARETKPTYLHLADGKVVPGKRVTIFDRDENPKHIHLYPPDGKTILATYSLLVESSATQVSWSPDVLYSKLPCKVYQYEGGKLEQIKEVPQGEWGSELGKYGETEVIFADDFKTVKAVLPRATLPEPIKQEGFEISRVGFTLVTLEGKESLLPFVYGELSNKFGRKTVVYFRVPEEFKEAFENLSREDKQSNPSVPSANETH